MIDLSEDQFGARLAGVLSPSRPIRTPEHLRGRERDLVTIKRALYATGRHIFIYGDRGVGKSSLAATAAYQYQSSDAEPIFIAGSLDETFNSLIANLVSQAIGRPRTESRKARRSAGFSWHGLRLATDMEISPLAIDQQIKSIGDAAELLKHVAEVHSEKPVVVVDEFDAIPDAQDRNKFAALLKQLGDQSVNIKFIFTGVGASAEELIGAHASAFRQLETLELLRLGWEGRRQIVEYAAGAFNLSVDSNVNWRIAIVSDGFPYYVHLIAEKMLWEAYVSREADGLGWDHYHDGLRAAIESINVELRRPYDKAVSHRAPEFEDAVWSTADGEDLFRSLSDLYGSYSVIAQKRAGRRVLERKDYAEILRKLKNASYGHILDPLEGRHGWYTYHEKMLRGYVRMQAEVNGVELTGEKAAPRQTTHVPNNARTGFRGSSIPRGVRIDEPLSDEPKRRGKKKRRC